VFFLLACNSKYDIMGNITRSFKRNEFPTQTVLIPGIERKEIPVQVTIINKNGKGGQAFAIHGKSHFVRYEWIELAQILAVKFDFIVYVPNLHSHPATAPDTGTQHSELALRHIIEHFKLQNFLLLGKSWGSKAAAKFASDEKISVSALILTNAVNQEYYQQIRERKVPALFVTNENDCKPKYNVQGAQKKFEQQKAIGSCNFEVHVSRGDSPALIRKSKKGGHHMTEDDVEPILKFTEKYYFDLGTEV